MTYEEKINKIKQNRSNQLNTKVGLESSEAEAIDENNFNKSYLWDDGSKGINDIFKLYYDEIIEEDNSSFTNPDISNYNESGWDTIFDQALNYTLPDNDIYINDEAHNWGQDFQSNTEWFEDNGLTINNGGISNLLNSVITNTGIEATEISAYTSDDDYPTSDAAQTALDAHIATIARSGVGLLGKRTQDINNAAVIVITLDSEYEYTLGDGSSDNSTYYSDPEKTDLLTSTLNLINAIKASANYQSVLNQLYSELDKVFNTANVNHNSKLYEVGITVADVGDDRANILNLINVINTKLGLNTDDETDDTIYGYYNFFNTDDGTNANFNTYLGNLRTLCNDILTLVNTRINDISNGNILGNTENDKWKKHRLFWSKTIIKKPDGSLTTIKSVEDGSDVKNGVIDKISVADNELSVLINNTLEWIPTTILYASYYNPVIDKQTKEITLDRNGLIFSGQFHIQGYKIFRRLAEDVLIDNSDWADTPIYTVTDIGENGYVKTEFYDTSIEKNKIYVYRVSAYDNVNDSLNNSASLQSKIYDLEYDLNLNIISEEINNIQCSKINIGVHKFKKNSYCVLVDNNDASNNGFYVITEIDDENVWIYPEINSSTVGNIYTTNAVVNTVL